VDSSTDDILFSLLAVFNGLNSCCYIYSNVESEKRRTLRTVTCYLIDLFSVNITPSEQVTAMLNMQ